MTGIGNAMTRKLLIGFMGATLALVMFSLASAAFGYAVNPLHALITADPSTLTSLVFIGATAPQYAASFNTGTPGTLTAANTATDGTGATGRALIFTAEAVSGGKSVLPAVILNGLGTNVKTNLRFFKNNGSTPETADNNSLKIGRAHV